MSLPAPSLDETPELGVQTLAAPAAIRLTTLGRFLESEVEGRIEKVSGQTFEKSELSQRSREIAMAVAEASYLNRVDPFLILSMIEVESRYNVKAVGTHGELGLMQIKPATARWVAPTANELHGCDLQQIRCNIMMGSTYVGHLQNRTATRATIALFREHVLRSYNLGPAKANRLELDRIPANESDVVSYATKIAKRADRMRSRYLAVALLQ